MDNDKVELLIKLDEKVNQHDKRIEKLENQSEIMYKMNTNIELLVQKLGTTNDEISGIKSEVCDLRTDINDVRTKSDKKTAQKWDKFIWLVGGAIIALVAEIVKTALRL